MITALNAFLKNAKDSPPHLLLAVIAVAIVAAIIKHQDAAIVLPLVGILALIVISLVYGSLRRR